MNIEDLIDPTTVGPEKHQLKTYLNQLITITSFKHVKSKIKKNDPRRKTVEITFTTEDGAEHYVITSARYLIGQLEKIQALKGFMTENSTVDSVTGRLIGDRIFGHMRNFRLGPATAPAPEVRAVDGAEFEDDEEEEDKQ